MATCRRTSLVSLSATWTGRCAAAVGSPWTQCCSRCCGWRSSALSTCCTARTAEHQRGPAGGGGCRPAWASRAWPAGAGPPGCELKGVRGEPAARKMISALQQLLHASGRPQLPHREHCCGAGTLGGLCAQPVATSVALLPGPEASVAILTGAGTRFRDAIHHQRALCSLVRSTMRVELCGRCV